jgi:hypothetical protein
MTIGNAIDGVLARTTRTWNYPSWWNLLVVLPWALGLAFCIHEGTMNSQIAGCEQTATGIVTAYEPANHNQYGYKFEVDGKSYTGLESPKGSELAIGKRVIVFYDPQNPSRNALTDFHDMSISALGPVPMLLFGIGMVTVLIFYKRRRGTTTPEPQLRS